MKTKRILYYRLPKFKTRCRQERTSRMKVARTYDDWPLDSLRERLNAKLLLSRIAICIPDMPCQNLIRFAHASSHWPFERITELECSMMDNVLNDVANSIEMNAYEIICKAVPEANHGKHAGAFGMCDLGTISEPIAVDEQNILEFLELTINAFEMSSYGWRNIKKFLVIPRTLHNLIYAHFYAHCSRYTYDPNEMRRKPPIRPCVEEIGKLRGLTTYDDNYLTGGNCAIALDKSAINYNMQVQRTSNGFDFGYSVMIVRPEAISLGITTTEMTTP